MIDLQKITQQKNELQKPHIDAIDAFMVSVEMEVNLIAPIWDNLSQERKSKLLDNSPILSWVFKISERLK